MAKFKWLLIIPAILVLVALPALTACPAPKAPTVVTTLYIGGTMSLTGAFAEDSAAILSGMQDYVSYVNDNHNMAPWLKDLKFPADVKLEVKYLDDGLTPEKALANYATLKSEGLLTEHIGGTVIGQALMAPLQDDNIGATSMSSGPFLLTPPRTIFLQYPIYTDELSAIADWFMEQWKKDGNTAKPRVAYLTNDTFGKGVLIPQMDDYLNGSGYELVGTQIEPQVPTAPPTTQLLWLKDNKVDLAIGAMICAGLEPTILEGQRLGMGPDQPYKIIFGMAAPAHGATVLRDMGSKANGYVCAGSYPDWNDPCDGMKLCNDMQKKYHPDKFITHIMYPHGVVEAMIQVDALRLALANAGKPADQLQPVDVLQQGFYKIQGLDTGGITSTPLTFSLGKVEGYDAVVVHQIQNDKLVKLGTWPLHHLYKH